MNRKAKLGIILSAIVLASCVTNPPPELKPLYTAEAVLIRVHELQNTANSLYDAKQLSSEKTKLIVTFTRESAVVLEDAQANWKEVIKSSWAALNKNIQPIDPQLQDIWKILDAVMNALQ